MKKRALPFLLLALSGLVTPVVWNPAVASDWWNPVDWFSRPAPQGEEQRESAVARKAASESESSPELDAERRALQQAAEAQRAAERAVKEARYALEQAEKARHRAERAAKERQNPVSRQEQSIMPTESAPKQESATEPLDESAMRNQERPPHRTISPEEAARVAHPGMNASTNTTIETNVSNQEAAVSNSRKEASDESPAQQASSNPPRKAESDARAASLEQAADKPNIPSPWNPLNWFREPAIQAQAIQESQSPETPRQQKASEPAKSEETAPQATAALIETEKGTLALELYPDQAPLTVANFVKLVNSGFYNRYNMRFHRVVPGFVVQTGDPTGTGAGGSPETIPLEVRNKLSHNAKGVVAMARGLDPNSATSQFYITLAPQSTLDGKYAVFGKVVSGLDVLDKIEKGTLLYGVKLVDINTVARDPGQEKRHFFSGRF